MTQGRTFLGISALTYPHLVDALRKSFVLFGPKGGGAKRAGLAASALSITAASAVLAQPERPVRIPDPDTAAMESQVREKIARQRHRVAEDSGSAEAWGRLGRTFQAHGLEPEAEAAYAGAEDLDPTDFRWSYLRGAALKNIRPVDALTAAERAAELNPGYAPRPPAGGGAAGERRECGSGDGPLPPSPRNRARLGFRRTRDRAPAPEAG